MTILIIFPHPPDSHIRRMLSIEGLGARHDDRFIHTTSVHSYVT